MEIFKDFKEGYQVSNLGNIKNPKGEVLKLRVDKAGYKTFKIKQKDYLVHRVALEVFNPVENMENKWVKRFDKNKLNNDITNLYWLDKPLPVIKKEKSKVKLSTKPCEYIPFEDEVFLPIKDYEDLYLLSNYGNIIQKETKLKVHNYMNFKENSINCHLYKDKKYKRIVVALEMLKLFKPTDNKYLKVNYIDNNVQNIILSNLEWRSYIKQKSEKIQKIENDDLLEGEVFVTCYNLDKYEVSNKGRLRHIYNKKIRSFKTTAGGYKKCNVTFNGKAMELSIHRLVLMSFNAIEGMENLYVNHINHIRDDNRLENLEWVTPKQNQYHSKVIKHPRSTNVVGIRKYKDEEYSINLYLGKAKTLEEAQKILFDACEKLNIDTKYFIREEN